MDHKRVHDPSSEEFVDEVLDRHHQHVVSRDAQYVFLRLLQLVDQHAVHVTPVKPHVIACHLSIVRRGCDVDPSTATPPSGSGAASPGWQAFRGWTAHTTVPWSGHHNRRIDRSFQLGHEV